ncbi:MAG: DNA primase [Planctomycetota bacterium]|nr:DNA primase [Planctomycetota bacterium]
MSDLQWVEFKEQVRSRTDLVDLVSSSVSLKPIRGGHDYIGLCPFHDDHSPSFHVYPDRQSYRCWACQEGGDCFSYVMKLDGVEFSDALLQLAERANIEPPKRRGGNSSGPQVTTKTKTELVDVMAWVEEQCHWYLLNAREAERARTYLADRKINAESIKTFRLGFHGPQWQWLLERSQGKFSPEQLKTAGVVSERTNGAGFRDHILFIDRIVFPIHDSQGRTVAFGGRVMPDSDTPNDSKYINGSESVLFTKSRLLYGFDVAKKSISSSKTVVVCEGYTDCIMAHQHGLTNFVATLGTAFTEAHTTLTKRMAERVVLTYDGDQAGRAAAMRALEKLLAVETDLRVLTLPAGMDPAEYLDAHGTEAMQSLIDSAPEAWDFKLKRTIEQFGTQSVDSRQRIADEMAGALAEAPFLSGTIRETMILQRLASRLGVAETTIRDRVLQLRNRSTQQRKYRVDSSPAAPTFKKNSGWGTEEELLAILMAAPERCDLIAQQVGAGDFQDPQLARFFQLCLDINDLGDEPSFGRVISETEDVELKAVAARIDEESRQRSIREKLIEDEEDERKRQERMELKKRQEKLLRDENTEEHVDEKVETKTFLQLTIEKLITRRDVESNNQLKARMSEESESTPTASASALDMLKLMQDRLQGRKTWNRGN